MGFEERPLLEGKEGGLLGTRPAEKIFTVSEVNREIRGLLEDAFPALWMEGEISNFKHHSSGHMYLSLKDERSQIGAVFFSRHNQFLKFRLEDGLKVLVRGRLSVYEPRGQYQIYIEQIMPKGIGELQLAFEQLKKKLESEGLFDPARKKPIPKFPQTIGVVTSPTGAAIRDILNVVTRRFHGTRVILAPVQVQGPGASAQIAQAIRDLNRYPGVEVLIVGRGGGSLEDLWAFNEEAVVRAVYDSRVPVISAVGHEIDWTLCDLVSDLRAPTPSAAAELVVQNREEVERFLEEVRGRLVRSLQGQLERFRETWEGLVSSYAFRQPRMLVQTAAQKCDEKVRQLQQYARLCWLHRSRDYEAAAGRLEALSPLAILRRGYSVTFGEDGALIQKKSQLKIGIRVGTRLQDAVFYSEIRSIEPK